MSKHFDNNGDQRINRMTVSVRSTTVVNCEFDTTGELKKQFGNRVYPQEQTIDLQGRPKTLKTWKDFSSNAGAAITT